MRLVVTTAIALGADAAAGPVTWFDAQIETDDTEPPILLGVATVATVTVPEAIRRGRSVQQLLESEGSSLHDLCGVYFDDEGLRPSYRVGDGNALLLITDLMVLVGYGDQRIEHELVRRVCESLGVGCDLAVMPYHSEAQGRYWSGLGFVVDTPDRARGWMHLGLSGQPEVAADDKSDARVAEVPNDTAN